MRMKGSRWQRSVVSARNVPCRNPVRLPSFQWISAFAGKTALVTGASIGIGRGIATALAREGVRLAVVARRRNLLEELEKEIGQKLVIIEQDFLQRGRARSIAEAALEGLGSVDILSTTPAAAGASARLRAKSSGTRRSRSTSRASASSRTSCCRR